VPVKQGYTKCSTCVVGENAIITADASIANAALANSVETLLIRSGHIALPGFDYGFIGGAAGLIDNSLLAVCGKLASHPDSGAIRAFCTARCVNIVELADRPLIDIGGIVTLEI
jgi:hypothetical protein